MNKIKNRTLIVDVENLSDIEEIDRIMVRCGVWSGIYYPYSNICSQEAGNPLSDVDPKEIPTIKSKC